MTPPPPPPIISQGLDPPLLYTLGTLSEDDDNGSENTGKKMNLRFFKLNRVYLDPLDMSNAGDFSWC